MLFGQRTMRPITFKGTTVLTLLMIDLLGESRRSAGGRHVLVMWCYRQYAFFDKMRRINQRGFAPLLTGLQ
ncbi:MAG: hypothetical protein U0932_08465 [Thiobacillus sp.]|nr:hypothetical protein [Kiritimatiellota bacterium]MDZ7594669.1 hypothetical protein [Thiobacillus sp.]